MILSADASVARQTNKRRAHEGWNTLFIGANRYSRGPGAPVPAEDVLFPVAFLVEKEAGAVVKSHFHQAEQYQVVVAGKGRMGLHALDGVAVHYTGPYTAYGPIVAAAEGLHWFTLRNGWDPGARYMPDERAGLRAGRASHPHREAVAEVPGVLTEAELARLTEAQCAPLLEPSADGVATWRYRLPPGASVTGPDPASGGGQFWLLLAGGMSAADDKMLSVHSCVFVPPEADALAPRAGAQGAEMLCMQFAVRARH